MELKKGDACSWLGLGRTGSRGCTGGDAKDFTALGGKVGSASPGIETEEGEAVDIGDEGVKLLTLGVGEVDKDAVLQPAKAQVDRLKAASQEIVLEVLHIVGSLGNGGIEAARLGLVKEVIDELDKLAAGLGDFGDHGFKIGMKKKGRRAGALGDGSVGKVRPGFQWRFCIHTRRPQFLQWAGSG